ncbi:MAG: PAS domain S-box protein [Flammeovirgaceae bacterium]|nr:PAS domain S-box protein [Flammeovirgaceae bacterium]
MFKKIKIGTKITLLLLSVVIISILAISYLSYIQSQESIQSRYRETLSVINSSKSAEITGLFSQLEANLGIIKKFNYGSQPVETFEDDSTLEVSSSYSDHSLSNLQPIYENYGYKNIIITDYEGIVINQYNKASNDVFIDQVYRNFNEVKSEARNIYYSDPFIGLDEKVCLYVATELQNEFNESTGFAIIEVDVSEKIFPIIQDYSGLGESGEILLCKVSGSMVRFISPLRKSDVGLMTTVVDPQNNDYSMAATKAVMNDSIDFIWDIDYNDDKTLASWSYIPNTKWGMIVKMDEKEINSVQESLIWTFFRSGGIILIFSIFISLIFSKFLTNPVLSLKNKLKLVSRGILPEGSTKSSNDEIGEMAYAVQDLVSSLKNTADFAHQIGEGNYNADFTPMSEDDLLGNALVTMSESIRESEKKDKERNWIVGGIAEISQLLRLHNNLEDLGDEITGYMVEKIGAIQGAFYTLNNEDSNEPLFEIKSSYAYGKKKYLKASFKVAEGLVGQCAAEQEVILRTEIPHDYVTISSGLIGDQRPSCLLLVPLITDEKIYGIMEFAGFDKFNKTQISFVEEISVIIARTIFNIKVNEKTVNLLQESQKMSEELQLQQEILRQNAEEMEATQEELKRTNHRLEDQILEVNRSQKRLQVLLENASEVITIYEKDGVVRYVSPSVEPILGYFAEDLIGFKDIENVHPNSVKTFEGMFDKLIKYPDRSITVQYEYKQSDGETVWLEATGNNLLNDSAIQGIVINSRDITERRRAEKEERMRSQMQALSENSPDLIKRLNNKGVFFYINPVISTLTSQKPEYYLTKSLEEVDIDEGIKNSWREIFDEVLDKKEKVSTEMNFPTLNGEERVMQVNAIPEFGENNKVESVLFVSHDITVRKKTEIEIRANNKKITESINYAKRIQTAILPDDRIIKQIFKDSFIFYQPRDVVSGDFPWFIQKGDDIYIAAADCTGHGVPGALISLIGYFILNDIVNGRRNLSAGVVLDRLNAGVTKTLRQDDEDATTRDGMDIALLRVNYKENFIEYAGANRPLYLFTNNELVQVKGNKFPIGGGKYKTRTEFTTHKMEIKKGDEYYMFSDGFPDQFGGELNKKFGNQRIRAIITERSHKDMAEVKEQFVKEFNDWKEGKRQTDDVLMIGIKF